ncbi:MAG: glycosyltransferase [Candidatus Acidiferrales bacterium]
MSTFVSVGNAHQPFTRLIHAVTSIARALPQPVVVQHGHTPFHSFECSGVTFLDMLAFESAVSEAEVLILHAGAGCVIHALGAGKAPVVMARRAAFGEHVDDHQVEFARELALAGRVVAVEHVAELKAAIERARTLPATVARSGPTVVEMVAAILTDAAEKRLNELKNCP